MKELKGKLIELTIGGVSFAGVKHIPSWSFTSKHSRWKEYVRNFDLDWYYSEWDFVLDYWIEFERSSIQLPNGLGRRME